MIGGREALRAVNGAPLTQVLAWLSDPSATSTLKAVCQWRMDTPSELAELMGEAGIVALDDSIAQTLKRLLLAGWTPLATLQSAIGQTAAATQSALVHATKRTRRRLERRGLRGSVEYRLSEISTTGATS